MKPTRSPDHVAPLRPKPRAPAAELSAPRGLEASTLSIDDDDYVVFSFPLPERRVPEGLSAAEREVVLLVCDGRSNAEIARARKTATRTVANQLGSIYSKLKVSGRLALVRLCVVGASPAGEP
jgi:DNA-binding CsgD family transcriptional regulator